ncbi:unnamed protein product [Moneuplotes crassus]|uniref:Uncharacterized protein n=1 Tax=Euplotes crassus TaxID=5936 RepID=A0AAD2D124_EUPCR|nr:unnamed protein product [Moneuplotes crassus]
MRIGQYFIPTFQGNDTSQCSEFDDVIISLSEQPVDPRIDLSPLVCYFIILAVLVGASYYFFLLVLKEWQITDKLYRSSKSEATQNEVLIEASQNINPSSEEIRGVSGIVPSDLPSNRNSSLIDHQLIKEF